MTQHGKPTEFYVTARRLDHSGRWIEGELLIWVNGKGDLHLHQFNPQRVLGESPVPPLPETWGEKMERQKGYSKI